ncbi:TfuA-like protein [Bradyrhizobium oligotrophicum S58]
MTCIVFTGPTLHPRDAALELEAEYLPPVQQGDVHRAALAKPAAIGIIDGYFEQVPSVWHKEILWAMANGIHVFGSASMGALRAAELYAFGMEGVGKVFAAYRDGVFEADDEVALIHGPAELGFPALSEPLVNIRFTLQKAVAHGVISEASRPILEALGKASFYPERSYPALLRGARSDGRLAAQEIDALEAWLPEHRVDQKREDALEMLQTMRRRFAGDAVPEAVDYAFEHTQLWDGLMQDAQRSAAAARETVMPDGTPHLMDELRLLAVRGSDLSDKAIARFLAASEAKRRGVRVDAQSLSAEIIRFRQGRGSDGPCRARGLDRAQWPDPVGISGADAGRGAHSIVQEGAQRLGPECAGRLGADRRSFRAPAGARTRQMRGAEADGAGRPRLSGGLRRQRGRADGEIPARGAGRRRRPG